MLLLFLDNVPAILNLHLGSGLRSPLMALSAAVDNASSPSGNGMSEKKQNIHVLFCLPLTTTIMYFKCVSKDIIIKHLYTNFKVI